MHGDILRLDLRMRRRSIAWYAGGIAVYAVLIVVMYPAVKSDTALSALVTDNPQVMALLGVAGSFTSPTGWVSGNLYGNFLPLLILLLTIGYGASSVAGQSEDGTLGLVASLPIGRRRLVAEKALVIGALAVPVAVVAMVAVFVGRKFDLNLDSSALVGGTGAVVLLGVDLGLIALLIGVLSGSRGLALGIGSGVAAASYLISSLASVAGWAHAVRAASLFYWALGSSQLSSGPSMTAWLVLLLVGAGLLGATLLVVNRLDIR